MTDTKRSRASIAAAAVALALLLGVSLFSLLGPGDGGGPAATSPGVLPSAAETTRGSTAPEGTEPLTAAPEGVTWELFRGVALPVSSTHGPTRVQGPVHSGFSRTPTGALLADAQISARILVDEDVKNLLAVAQAQLVDGPGKTAYLNLLSQLEENDMPATGYAQIAGFRFITFTPDLAVISRATRDQSGRLQASTDTMRWIGGDWRLDKPATGLQQPQVVQDLSGYIPWSGIS